MNFSADKIKLYLMRICVLTPMWQGLNDYLRPVHANEWVRLITVVIIAHIILNIYIKKEKE